ncbi:hypothetical protein J4Q44_G00049030, partial [Coregonus suidteri]
MQLWEVGSSSRQFWAVLSCSSWFCPVLDCSTWLSGYFDPSGAPVEWFWQEHHLHTTRRTRLLPPQPLLYTLQGERERKSVCERERECVCVFSSCSYLTVKAMRAVQRPDSTPSSVQVIMADETHTIGV